MFKNLRAEMAREGLTGNDIAKAIGITSRSFSSKMTCNTEFTRSEMLKIKKFFLNHYSRDFMIEVLFELEESKKTA